MHENSTTYKRSLLSCRSRLPLDHPAMNLNLAILAFALTGPAIVILLAKGSQDDIRTVDADLPAIPVREQRSEDWNTSPVEDIIPVASVQARCVFLLRQLQ